MKQVLLILLAFTFVLSKDIPDRTNVNYTLASLRQEPECGPDNGIPLEQKDCKDAPRGFKCCFVAIPSTTSDTGYENYCMMHKKNNKTDLNEMKAFVAIQSQYAIVTCDASKLMLSSLLFLTLLLL